MLTIIDQPACCSRGQQVQGYLAHKKQPPPLGPPYDLGYSPTVGSWEGGVSYERGTPRGLRYLSSGEGVKFDPKEVRQGYLAHKKPHPPGTLQYGYA